MLAFKYVAAVVLGAASYFFVSAIIVGVLKQWAGLPEQDAMIVAYIIIGALSGAAIVSVIRQVHSNHT